MHLRPHPLLVLSLLAGLVGLSPLATSAPALAAATTIGGDTLRTSWDRNERGLAPTLVSSPSFGPLFSTAVVGQVFAQPVVASGPGGSTLVAVTEADHAYGLDPVTGAVRWDRAVGPAWSPAALDCGDLVPTVGITSTPVADASTGAVYFTSKVDDGADAQHPHWYMHGVDAATGAERPGFPVLISGAPTNDPAHPFTPETAMQRPGLLLLDGKVYAAFASHCDASPYTGYVVGVDTVTATLSTMWATESGSAYAEGGIWQSGAGLVSDGPGSILFTTGNGLSPAPGAGTSPPSTLGESVVRLHVQADGTLRPVDFFSPTNNKGLDLDDQDLGSGGPLALPDGAGTPAHPHLLVQIGKDGRVFLLDRDHLGGAAQGPGGTDAVLGTSGPYAGVWGKPAYFGGSTGGYVYAVENNGPLRVHAVRKAADGTVSLAAVATSAGTFGYTSGQPVVTSVGDDPSTALVWVVYCDGPTGADAELRAYDAVPDTTGVLRQRYSYRIGTASKFVSLATDGGRVYVGTRDGKVWAFGSPTTAAVTATGSDLGLVPVGGTVTGSVHLTASRALTVTALSATPPFTTAAHTPTTLVAGARLDVPVTLTPTAAGSQVGTLMATVTSASGTEVVPLDLRGYGTHDGLLATPTAVAYDTIATGAPRQLPVTVVNTGTTPATIRGIAVSGAAFSLSGAPAAGTVVPPQASLPLTVLADPRDPGPFSGALTVAADTGSVLVPLSGTAEAGAPHMTLPARLDLGDVPVGLTQSSDFAITNDGNIPMTITKAKAPAGVFTSSLPLPEGLVVPPGDTVHQPVTFTPTAVGLATSTYLITADDGQGMQAVTLTANGTSDPITVHYQALGGGGFYRPSVLGDPLTAEYGIPGGQRQDFDRGSILWSPATGAWSVQGAILSAYDAAGGPQGPLGFPTSDEVAGRSAGSRRNDFAHGSMYWSAPTGAHAVYGAIYAEYVAMGQDAGVLGLPLTDETGTPDGVGRYNHFSLGGSLYWTPTTGAHAIYGAIRAEWAATGWERGPLGYPVTDEVDSPGGGRRNDFSNGGLIDWTPATGAHALYGAIRAHWQALGAELGPLGYPTTDELGTPDQVGRFNHFSGSGGASVYWTPGTGAWAVYGAIRAAWAASGWERGRYGYPVSDEYGVPGGRRSDFQRGSITWHP